MTRLWYQDQVQRGINDRGELIGCLGLLHEVQRLVPGFHTCSYSIPSFEDLEILTLETHVRRDSKSGSLTARPQRTQVASCSLQCPAARQVAVPAAEETNFGLQDQTASKKHSK